MRTYENYLEPMGTQKHIYVLIKAYENLFEFMRTRKTDEMKGAV
jgi:hypothetical protein